MDRRGHVTPTRGAGKDNGHRVRLSPDGRTLVVNVTGLHDLTLWTSRPRARHPDADCTSRGKPRPRCGRPDGRHIAFSWNLNGRRSLAWLRADGTGAVESLVTPPFISSSWTPDGRQLAGFDSLKYQPRLVTLDQGRAWVVPFPDVPETAWNLEFSPDGQWLVYNALDADQSQVYVRALSRPGPASSGLDREKRLAGVAQGRAGAVLPGTDRGPRSQRRST